MCLLYKKRLKIFLGGLNLHNPVITLYVELLLVTEVQAFTFNEIKAYSKQPIHWASHIEKKWLIFELLGW